MLHDESQSNINHDNEADIFRIAVNSIALDLRIWTWGYPPGTFADPTGETDEARPYIELWAAITREFWQGAESSAKPQYQIEETFSPSIGVPNVTHANTNFLANLDLDSPSAVACQLFGL